MKIEKTVEFFLGHKGHMVGGSKSIYSYDHPNNFVIFNANLVIDKTKVWYGDIDLTLSIDNIKQLAEELNTDLYILYEMDARFENETSPLLDKAAVIVRANGTVTIRDSDFYYWGDHPNFKSQVPYVQRIEVTEEVQKNIQYNEDDYISIKLPNLASFKINKTSEDPFTQLQIYFIDTYKKEEAIKLFRALYVTKSYMDKLNDLSEKYAKKLYPNLHPVKLKQSLAILRLAMAPFSFENEQSCEKPNTGYIKKDKYEND